MTEQKKENRGGWREGAGRKRTGYDHPVSFRLSRENKEWVDNLPNKTKWLNGIIDQKREGQ